jgi:hypothetical protein
MASRKPLGPTMNFEKKQLSLHFHELNKLFLQINVNSWYFIQTGLGFNKRRNSDSNYFNSSQAV